MALDVLQEATLQGLIGLQTDSDDFKKLSDTDKGLSINKVIGGFQNDFATPSKEDTDQINQIANNTYSAYKNVNNQERYYVPSDQMSQFGPALNVNPEDSKDDQLKAINNWKDAFTKSASTMMPANADDIQNQASIIADDASRTASSKGDWYVHELINRGVGGAVKPLISLLGGQGADNWFDQSYLGRTNPQYDSDLTSQITSGLGTIASLAVIGIATGGIGDAIGIGTEAGATLGNLGYFNATMMHDAYQQELQRSGDPSKAWDNAISQIPAASVQAIGDMAMMRMGLGELIPDLKGFKQQWLAATTDEAKQQIIKNVIPTIGQESLRGGLIGAAGMVAQDTLSGIGSYYATGDEKYLKSVDQLAESGLVGGVLGIGAGAVSSLTGHAQNVNREKIAQSLTDVQQNQQAIFGLLQNGDYKGVADLYANNFITPDTKPEFTTPQAATTPLQKSYPLDSGVTFTGGEVKALRDLQPPSADDPNYDSLKADYDRKKTALDQIQDGSLPLKTQTSFTLPDGSGDLGAPVGPHTITLEDGSNINDHLNNSSAKQDGVFSKGDKVTLADGSQATVNFQEDAGPVNLTDTQTGSVGTVINPNSLTHIPESSNLKQNVVFVKDPSIANKFTTLGVKFGELSLVDSGDGEAIPLVRSPDGTLKKGDSNSTIDISNTPQEGWTPIVVNDKTSGEQDSQHTSRSLQILPPVKSVDLFSESPDYTHVQTITKKNGEPKAVIAQDKNNNKITVPAETPLGKQLIQQYEKKQNEGKAVAKLAADATQVEGVEPTKETISNQLPKVYSDITKDEPIQSTALKTSPTADDLKTLGQRHTEALNEELDAKLSEMAEKSNNLHQATQELTQTAIDLAKRDINGKFISNVTPEQFDARVNHYIDTISPPKTDFSDFVKKSINSDEGIPDAAKAKWTPEVLRAAQNYFESGSIRDLDDLTSGQRSRIGDLYSKFSDVYKPSKEELTDAGFKKEKDARAAYNENAIKTETYNEFLKRRSCE